MVIIVDNFRGGKYFAFFNVVLVGIYNFDLFRHCGSRPAGELLFCQQQQKSNQKNAAT